MIETASSSNGVVPTQNFDHRSSRIDIGLERNSHIVRPSSDTPGKMNRAAIEASTKPANTIFKNGTTFTKKNVIPSPLSGKNLMLNTYTNTNTPSRMSCDH